MLNVRRTGVEANDDADIDESIIKVTEEMMCDVISALSLDDLILDRGRIDTQRVDYSTSDIYYLVTKDGATKRVEIIGFIADKDNFYYVANNIALEYFLDNILLPLRWLNIRALVRDGANYWFEILTVQRGINKDVFVIPSGIKYEFMRSHIGTPVIDMDEIYNHRAEYVKGINLEMRNPENMKLFEAYMPEVIEIIKDAVCTYATNNDFKIHIPRPALPEWREINMLSFCQYIYYHGFGSGRQTKERKLMGAEYDPLTDSIVILLWMDNAKAN